MAASDRGVVKDNVTLNNISPEMLLSVCAFLDPFNLAMFYQTNKSLHIAIAQANYLWKHHLETQFPNTSICKSTINYNVCFNNTALFYYVDPSEIGKNGKDKKRSLSQKEVECFTLVRTNDLEEIKARKIIFTKKLLELEDFCDAHTLFRSGTGYSLEDVILKQGCPAVKSYVATQLPADPEISRYQLIFYFVKFNHVPENFEKLIIAESYQTNLMAIIEGMLTVAAANNSVDSVRAIMTLQEKHYPNNKPGYKSLLKIAIKNGSFEVFEFFYNAWSESEKKKGKFISNKDKIYLLHKAIRSFPQSMNVCECLVKQVTDINLVITEEDDTVYEPILYAAVSLPFSDSRFKLVNLLLENHADVNQLNHRGWSALHYAALGARDHHDILTLLLKYNAKVDMQEEMQQMTPLHIVCKSYCNDDASVLPTVTSLIKAGASPLIENVNKQKPSQLAISSKPVVAEKLELIERIASYGMQNLAHIQPLFECNPSCLSNAIRGFLVISCKNATITSQAEMCLYLLSNTSTPFGCAVVLTALLNSNHNDSMENNKFIDCILNELGFESKIEAKHALYSMIYASLNYNDSSNTPSPLLQQIKETILAPIETGLKENEPKEFYDNLLLGLNFIEAHIKKAPSVQAKIEIKDIEMQEEKAEETYMRKTF